MKPSQFLEKFKEMVEGGGLVSEFMSGIGSTNFQLNLTILSFWTKFAQKEYFRLKTEDVNTTIEFWIFELC